MGLRLVNVCVLKEDWAEAYLLLFYMNQRQLHYAQAGLLRMHEAAAVLLAVLVKTDHLEELPRLVQVTDCFYGNESEPSQIRDRLLALKSVLHVLRAALAEGVPQVETAVAQSMAQVLARLLQSRKLDKQTVTDYDDFLGKLFALPPPDFQDRSS